MSHRLALIGPKRRAEVGPPVARKSQARSTLSTSTLGRVIWRIPVPVRVGTLRDSYQPGRRLVRADRRGMGWNPALHDELEGLSMRQTRSVRLLVVSAFVAIFGLLLVAPA